MQFFLKWLYDVCAEFRWQPEITAINYRALYTANDWAYNDIPNMMPSQKYSWHGYANGPQPDEAYPHRTDVEMEGKERR